MKTSFSTVQERYIDNIMKQVLLTCREDFTLRRRHDGLGAACHPVSPRYFGTLKKFRYSRLYVRGTKHFAE